MLWLSICRPTALVQPRLAEAIRDGFVKIARQVDGQGGGAPVSIGVSHCEGRSMDVSSLFAQTDRTL